MGVGCGNIQIKCVTAYQFHLMLRQIRSPLASLKKGRTNRGFKIPLFKENLGVSYLINVALFYEIDVRDNCSEFNFYIDCQKSFSETDIRIEKEALKF